MLDVSHAQGSAGSRRNNYTRVVQAGMLKGMYRIRPIAGHAAYRLVGVGWRIGRWGAWLLRPFRRRPRSGSTGDIAPVRILVQRVSKLTPVARIRTRLWLAWSFAWRTQWAGFDWYVKAETRGRTVSIAGIVDREGAVGGVPTHLGLLGGVFTHPQYQRRGLASEVVRRATEFITDDLRCDFGVLICSDDLVPFYERLGWRRVSNVMKFERYGETGVVVGKVMVFECAGRPLPAGTIDVRGLPA